MYGRREVYGRREKREWEAGFPVAVAGKIREITQH